MKISLTLGDQIYEGDVNLKTVPPEEPPYVPPEKPPEPPEKPPEKPPVIPPSGPCVPPPYAQELPLNTRLDFNPGIGETVYCVPITQDNIARLIGQIAGLPGVDTTDVEVTWIMPDCKEFKAYATGTDNGANLDIRSKNAVQPNIDYNYVPVGKHTLKIKAKAPSCFMIRFVTY